MTDEFSNFRMKQGAGEDREEEPTTSQYYTFIGHHDYIDGEGSSRHYTEKKDTFAKQESGKYFIKIGLDNRAYNPIGMFDEGQHNKILAKVGKNQFNFKRVNKKVFDLYTTFLRTRNLSWLNNANREIL